MKFINSTYIYIPTGIDETQRQQQQQGEKLQSCLRIAFKLTVKFIHWVVH